MKSKIHGYLIDPHAAQVVEVELEVERSDIASARAQVRKLMQIESDSDYITIDPLNDAGDFLFTAEPEDHPAPLHVFELDGMTVPGCAVVLGVTKQRYMLTPAEPIESVRARVTFLSRSDVHPSLLNYTLH